ncbi:MAG: DUF86 domain-containing protein [Pelatocladus maniniholoensis HA4357-MV3]|jgi:uncharacterized protein with HEPN domain|uniref:DUF86 domain-containing protein n=1 Tax=Pelatocladus maniniholoensis HA4357-MV3 TaxID=1117104 RepID=A0A9E3LUK9_9NOST|nr:DUF86 domain-containing protein [Pelatocladus maniniholoensis HA4357-MV3]BAZ65337.1 hypothetical protein NIES4106_00750 [Fischerella sp. NIES-4106]
MIWYPGYPFVLKNWTQQQCFIKAVGIGKFQESHPGISLKILLLRYANGVSKSELETNDEKLSAILYQITIIGEATKRLSQSFRQQHQEIPWRQMAGMPDVIVHEYDQLDFDLIWDVVENKLPELLNLIDSLL